MWSASNQAATKRSVTDWIINSHPFWGILASSNNCHQKRCTSSQKLLASYLPFFSTRKRLQGLATVLREQMLKPKSQRMSKHVEVIDVKPCFDFR